MNLRWFFISILVYMNLNPSEATPASAPNHAAGEQLQAVISPEITRSPDVRIPFGAVIERCSVPGTVALTFDDGPYLFTARILDILRDNGARATFFLNGARLGSIYEYADLVRRALNEGHQIGSHTWNHPYLTTLDRDGIISQMTQLEDAFMSIIGRRPTYMRPPYLAINDLVVSTMGELGYHIIQASVDTKDYENDHPDMINRSIEKFRNELTPEAIVLAHDVHYHTVERLTQAMLNEIRARGLRVVPVGECLGEPPERWYTSARGSAVNSR